MLIMRGLGDYTASQPGGAAIAPSGSTAYNPETAPPVATTSATATPGGSSFAPVPVASDNAFAPAKFVPVGGPTVYTRDGKTYTAGQQVFVPGAQTGGPSGGQGSGPVPVADRSGSDGAAAPKSSALKWILLLAAAGGGYYWWKNR